MSARASPAAGAAVAANPAAPKKKASINLTGGSAMEEAVMAHMARVIASLTPLVAQSQRGSFLVNATRMFSGEPRIAITGGRSKEGEATARLLSERRDGSTYAVGYYYGAGTGPKQPAFLRAKNSSKMPLPPKAPRVLNQSPRGPKPIFRHAVRAEGEFNVPTMYRNWDKQRHEDEQDSEVALYGGAAIGESVVAG